MGSARQEVGASMPYMGIYVGEKGRSTRNRVLRGPGKAGCSSKHAVYGHMWAGTKRVSETTPHVGKGRQGGPVTTPHAG